MPKRAAPTARAPSPSPRVSKAASSLTVVAIGTVVAFLPALGAGFVNYDDDRVIVHNPYLHQPFAEFWKWMWTTTFVGHYQPLTWGALWIDAHAGAFRPAAFHVGNVALHVVAALLVAATLARLLRVAPSTREATGSTIWLASACAALFWAIHPLRVESVAWVSEERDPLSTIFWVAAVYAYLRYVAAQSDLPSRGDSNRPPGGARSASAISTRWYLLSIAALVCSLLAKAWGMTFFVVLLAIDWGVLRRRAWLEKVPFAAAGAIAATVAWFAQRSARETMLSIEQWGWLARTLQACYGLCFYVWKTAVPTGLAILYEIPRSWREMAPAFIVSAVVVAFVAIGLTFTARRYRALAAAAVAYAVTLGPVLGLAQSGPQLVADRYAYVSSLALTAIVAAGLVFLARRIGVRAVVAVSAAVLVAFGVLTYRQAGVWHDSVTLWRHAIDTGHGSYRAHFDLGQALRADGRLDEAVTEYRLALDIRPESGNAWYVYANALKAKGRTADAEAAYRQATSLGDPSSAEWMLAHVNLGNLYFNSQRLDQAVAEYRAAVSQFAGRPSAEVPPEPYLYLGMALGDKGDYAGARQALEVAMQYPATRVRAMVELRRISAAEDGKN